MSTSRLCVKNIPKYVDEEQLKKHFHTCFKTSGSSGVITDVKILKTKDGRPRKIAFIGFKESKDAITAQKYFNKSFFDTSKLSVEVALPYGDIKLSRPWSKHSKNAQKEADEADAPNSNLKTVKKATKKDKKLQEFLLLMQPRSKSQFWANDDTVPMDTDKAAAEKGNDNIDADNKLIKDNNQVANEKYVNENGKSDTTKIDRQTSENKLEDIEEVAESGRLFIRNLSYNTTEDEIRSHFEKFGPTAECYIPTDESKRSRGFGYITYVIPEHAVKAMAELDMKIFHGRLLHIMPGIAKQTKSHGHLEKGEGSSYQQKKDSERRKNAENDTKSWNALFVRSDAAVSAVANEMGVGKGDILDESGTTGTSAALRVALSETRVIAETKEFLKGEGVDLQALEYGIRNPDTVKRSETCMLLKNLPSDSNVGELRQMFARFGDLEKFVLPQSKTMALVSFYEKRSAKKCFKSLAYKRYKRVPIYLEWAPENVLKCLNSDQNEKQDSYLEVSTRQDDVEIENTSTGLHTLFVKNLNFDTTEENLRKHFIKVGSQGKKDAVLHVSVPRKNKSLSMGYGFVQMSDASTCRLALRRVHESMLDGHTLEVKISRKTLASINAKSTPKRKEVAGASGEEKNTKIIVRNLAFEATKKELKQLFAAYGQVNTVRLPKKYDGTHRGFAFVDFVTNQEAKAAFEALSTTHLYGRKLVIEWAKDVQSLEALRNKSDQTSTVLQSPQKKARRNTTEMSMDLDGY
mmetsp:Transcript_3809/g.4468  ORF Transcript_3809/g.4468 Transcript_3809/m.4468 type:complete len:747 (+) Transcript_3809:208-2448(+)